MPFPDNLKLFSQFKGSKINDSNLELVRMCKLYWPQNFKFTNYFIPSGAVSQVYAGAHYIAQSFNVHKSLC